jgi:hypothetical protein
MKAKSKRRSNCSTAGIGSFTDTDALEYSRIRDQLCTFLRKAKRYEPAVDDIQVDLIVESIISLKKVGTFLKSKNATEFTFSRVADAQMKYAKIINDAFDHLSISRRDRPIGQDQANANNQMESRAMKIDGLKGLTKNLSREERIVLARAIDGLERARSEAKQRNQ